MESKLYSIAETKAFINKGYLLTLAADERVLSQLPKGSWLGGTIPYFMDINMSLFSQDKIFVNKLSDDIIDYKLKIYDDQSIYNIVNDSFDNGYTLLLLPPFQKVQKVYALESPKFEGIYNNPIIGWIAGSEINSDEIPKVFNGFEGEVYDDKAIALHVKLPENKEAKISIVNIFEKDTEGAKIKFINSGLDVHNCIIDGKEVNLVQYIKENDIDIRLPLMSEYNGFLANISIKEIDYEYNIVSFFAPVFKERTYYFSKHIDDYAKCFEIKTQKIKSDSEVSFNCIHNYLYGKLENKKINNITGPFTFGEIAYHLLNQTLVSLNIEDKKNDAF